MQTNLNIPLVDNAGVTGIGPATSLFWSIALDRLDSKSSAVRAAFRTRNFSTEVLNPEFYEGFRLIFNGKDRYEEIVVMEDSDRRIIQLSFYPSEHNMRVAVFTENGVEDAESVLEAFAERIPVRKPKGEEWVNVSFWTLGPNGQPAYQDRDIEAALWEDVRLNYPGIDAREQSVRTSLDRLHDWTEPPPGGRLLLLHGPAGTGKTRALAALSRSWKDWCSVHYVVDPDQFFGSAHYMMNVLLDFGRGQNEKWRLVIIEDADELLSADAKHRKGQDVSRLLNLCDGLIGQGLRILVLITTNEEVGKMHPAIIRSGRCLANLSVGKLAPEDANAWRVAHDMKPLELGRSAPAVTLAELYEELNEFQVKSGGDGRRRIGFN